MEKHQDGNNHIHAAISYSQKLNIRDMIAFDVGDYHPNIQSARNWGSVKAYVCKDNQFICAMNFDSSDPNKYIQRKNDFNACIADREAANRAPIDFPILLPDRTLWTPIDKKRHLWIIGPPDWGKSKWAMDTFNGRAIYIRPDTNYPFESYVGERVILYDDLYPKQEEWLNVSNWHWGNMHVFGATRYKNVLWPNKIDITMIVLSNMDPFFTNMEAFNARFTIIRLQ